MYIYNPPISYQQKRSNKLCISSKKKNKKNPPPQPQPNRPKSAIKRRHQPKPPRSASPGSTAVPLESKSPKVTPVTSEKRRGPAKRGPKRGVRGVVVVTRFMEFFWGGGVGFTSLGGRFTTFFSGKCLCNCLSNTEITRFSCFLLIGTKCVNKRHKMW